MQTHPVVSREAWLTARKALLEREREETHLRDAVNAERLALPWVEVEKDYIFDTPTGRRSLAELFASRSQLLVYHFMLAPGWAAGCPGCSFLADHFDGTLPHLNHHDVTLTAVSRAPLSEIEAYKRRMGWHFPWVSSNSNDFNFDYHVSFLPGPDTNSTGTNGTVDYNFEQTKFNVTNDNTELPGMSSFIRDEDGQVFHTYSSYARGIEDWIGTLMLLDRAPKGRNERSTMDFVRRHDEYEDSPKAHTCCSEHA